MPQSPMQQIAERFAEAVPGLAVAAKMEALDNFRKSNESYRRRLEDGHRWQAEALGMKASPSPEEEPVGNLTVTGDIYGKDAAEILAALQGQQASPQPPQNQPSTAATAAQPTAAASSAAVPGKTGWAQNLGRAVLLAAAMAGSGGIGAGAMQWLAKPTVAPAPAAPVAAQPVVVLPAAPDGQRFEIEVIPGGANPSSPEAAGSPGPSP